MSERTSQRAFWAVTQRMQGEDLKVVWPTLFQSMDELKQYVLEEVRASMDPDQPELDWAIQTGISGDCQWFTWAGDICYETIEMVVHDPDKMPVY